MEKIINTEESTTVIRDFEPIQNPHNSNIPNFLVQNSNWASEVKEKKNISIQDTSISESSRISVSLDKTEELVMEIGKDEFYQGLFQKGNWEPYYGSQNEADLGLMSFLARITNASVDLMKELFSKSALGQRDEWRKDNEYQDQTVEKALNGYKSKNSFDLNIESDGKKYLSKLPSFPIGAFPEPFAKFVTEVSESFSNLPLEIPGVTLLSVAGSLIGQVKKIQPKKGWTESANNFFIIVAASGEGKSPAMKTVVRPVEQWEVKKLKEYNEEMAEHQSNSESEPTTPVPTRSRLIVIDTTPEALMKVFSENPRGLLWYSDEIGGLILNLNRYSKGDSKHILMSCYDGSPITIDRKVGGTMHIENPCLSMLGSIQPNVLSKVFKEVDSVNGLLARTTFVFASREKPIVWTERIVNKESIEFFTRYVKETLNDEKSEVVKLTGEGKSIFVDWVNQRSQAIHLCPNDKQRSVQNKANSKALKLICILHHMKCFAEKKAFDSLICPEVVKNALLLMDCLNAHQNEIWSLLEKPKLLHLNPFDKRVAQEVIKFSSEDAIYPGRVAERINSKPKAVASSFKRIGLEKGIRISEGTPYTINQKLLDQLKEVLC
jgi:hypothetical protein